MLIRIAFRLSNGRYRRLPAYLFHLTPVATGLVLIPSATMIRGLMNPQIKVMPMRPEIAMQYLLGRYYSPKICRCDVFANVRKRTFGL
jgi:hypothetical protein